MAVLKIIVSLEDILDDLDESERHGLYQLLKKEFEEAE